MAWRDSLPAKHAKHTKKGQSVERRILYGFSVVIGIASGVIKRVLRVHDFQKRALRNHLTVRGVVLVGDRGRRGHFLTAGEDVIIYLNTNGLPF